MYWIGLVIVSLVWSIGSWSFPDWIRYGMAFVIGLCYYVAFA